MAYQAYPPASGGLTQRVVEFTSSGTFTLPAGYGVSNPLICDIIILGAGGGGGGGGRDNGLYSHGGGGGGSGCGLRLTNHPVTSNTTITIGAGGSGGAATSGVSNGNNGTNGGDSSFGSYTAPGGGYGGGGGGTNIGQGNAGSDIFFNGKKIFGGRNISGVGQSMRVGGGGAGGSGGGSYYNGGVFGSVGQYGGNSGSIVNGNPTYQTQQIKVTNFTAGFSQFNPGGQIYQLGSAEALINPSAIIETYQEASWIPGGGGAGGMGYDLTYGLGGNAGTATAGGTYGTGQQSSGSRTGQTATVPGAGGGGGGAGSSGTSQNGGAGGAGASGLVRIVYWA